MIKSYTKKPVTIQAIQFVDVKSALQILSWMNQYDHAATYNADTNNNINEIRIHTLEGVMTASLNDYIICGVENEFYPCKPEIFKKTYDEV